MWKNKFRRQGSDRKSGDERSASENKAVKENATSPLPSKEDRLALYRLLETVVLQRCQSLTKLTDPRSLGVKAFFVGKNVPPVASFGIRKRQIDYLRLHALPTMGAALLLGIEDIQGEGEPKTEIVEAISTASEETESSRSSQEEEGPKHSLALPHLSSPFDCITLLISNMVLVSQGNYDSRVRNILKAACVPLLEEALMEQDDAEDENKARSLYFLTEEHTKIEKASAPRKQNKSISEEEEEEEEYSEQVESISSSATKDTSMPEKEEASLEQTGDDETVERTVDWERTTRIPKLSRCRRATQQFEAVERAIATDILKELVERDQAAMQHARKANTWKDNVVRGLQITTMGVVTGGLAAPGLVAAITALGVHSTAVFAALTTTTALASMFGAVGGGLGAYKMSKRVQGISEWRIRKETTSKSETDDAIQLRGLHSHVCVSGWLVEKCDFQRPFGVKCNDPVMPPLRALQRFFCVHAPERVKQADTLLKENKQEDLWAMLKEEYGETPHDLLPLEGRGSLVSSKQSCCGISDLLVNHVLPENAVSKMKELWEVNTMLTQMVAKNEELQAIASFIPDEDGGFDEEELAEMEVLKNEAQQVVDYDEKRVTQPAPVDDDEEVATDNNSFHSPSAGQVDCRNNETRGSDVAEELVASVEDKEEPFDDSPVATGDGHATTEEDKSELSIEERLESQASEIDGMNDHLEIIWDWQATYSGEMYTLTWETDFLLKLCRVATVLFLEISDTVGKQILLNALVGSVVAIPSALWTASIVIDDPYQLISLRSKKAGVELAHCLLSSDEHRPISLVGFSFGARLIFDCLLELARHQLIWQEQQERKENADDESAPKGRMGFLRRRRSRDGDKIDYVREPASIVEDVVLIGMPRVIDLAEWISCREVVGGRLCNCFNRSDWIVSYMINIRCFNAVSKTCGTHEVKMEGVENFEVSEFASTHDRYLAAVPQILHKLGYSQPHV